MFLYLHPMFFTKLFNASIILFKCFYNTELFSVISIIMYSPVCIHCPWLEELSYCPQMTELHIVIHYTCSPFWVWSVKPNCDHVGPCYVNVNIFWQICDQTRPSVAIHACVWFVGMSSKNYKNPFFYYKIAFKPCVSGDHNMPSSMESIAVTDWLQQ